MKIDRVSKLLLSHMVMKPASRGEGANSQMALIKKGA